MVPDSLTATDVASQATLVDRLRERAKRTPDQRAFSYLGDGERDGSGLSYGELDRNALDLGARLHRLELNGSRALLLYPPGLDYLSAFFGCLYGGVVAVPAYPPRPNRPMPRLEAIAADAGASVVLTTTAIRADAQRWLDQTPELARLRWLETDQLDGAEAGSWPGLALEPSAPAFLQYTSGSTSAPKGVVVTHANLMHNSARIQRSFGTSSQSRGVFWLPLYHDMGLIGGVVQTVYCGGTSTLLSPVSFLQRPVRWLQAITRTRATISGGPDFAYDLCIRKVTAEQRAELDLSSWELAFDGAEPIRPETLRRFVEAFSPHGFRANAFYPCYGLAESTLIVSGGTQSEPVVTRGFRSEDLVHGRVVECPDTENDRRTLVGCGQSPSDQAIVIADPETLTPRPDGLIGEIWVSSPSVAQGYWNRPEESARVFQARRADTGAGPFLRTGDLGFLKDGELYVTGRLKDLIVIRGRNFAPHDLEWTVEACHPAFRPSAGAAISIECAGQERLVILQEVERHERNGDTDGMIAAIRHDVASHHDIEVFAVALLKPGTIPKTSSGKIQRHVCREGFLAGSLSEIARWTNALESAPPRAEIASSAPPGRAATPPEAHAIRTWLVERLAERLGVEPRELDVHAPFVSFGMSSAQAVALSGELEEWLGRRLSPTLIYNYPTIDTLARYLAGRDTPEPSIIRHRLQADLDAIRAQALAEVEGISDEESDLLISQQIAKYLR